MTPASQKKLLIVKALLAIVVGTIAGAMVYFISDTGPWIVPESAKEAQNPLQPSDSALQSIRSIYLDKCSSCHGDSGKGDGHDASLYDPRPTNFTDAKGMQDVTDGELFYKMTQGRRPMPSFKKRLSDEQRWQLVLLIRSFAATSIGTTADPTANADPANKH